jgi:hypothetical protein
MEKEATLKCKELKTKALDEKRGNRKTQGAQKQINVSFTKLAPLN